VNVSPDLEGRVADWLDARATADGSDRVLAAALEEVSHVRQERAPSSSRLRRVARPMVMAAALAVALVVVAVTAIPPVPETASARVTGVWPVESDVAFTADLPSDASNDIYWRAASYDTWSSADRGWRSSAEASTSVPAGSSIVDVADEPMRSAGMSEIAVTISPRLDSTVVVAPGIPAVVDQATVVETMGPGGPLVQVSLSRPATSYRVTGLGGSQTSVSATDLMTAGTDYPDDVRTRYAQAPAASELGAASMAFLGAARASSRDDPYDLAAEIVEAFHDPGFTYDVDTRDIDCRGDGFTECFLRTKRGYCMYFATAMIMLLRHEGIPARMVMGFLPGERVESTVTVRTHDAHAWVEVFFPGWGWIAFDPTPRDGASRLAPGPTP
jgi:transglutaminase superfamily protein